MYYLNPLGNRDPVVLHGTNDAFSEHFHSNFELVFIDAGERIVEIDGQTYREPMGSLTVIFPFQLHRFSGGGGRCAWIGIHPEALFAHTDVLFGKKPAHPVIRASELPERAQVLTKMLMSGAVTDKIELNALTVALFCEISAALRPETRQDSSIGSDIFPLISKHLCENDFTQQKLARMTGIGERMLYNFFTKNFGMSFSAFIRKYRIDTAAQLLRSGKRVRITDLAYDCGFSSIRTFNRCFQAEYRMSPVEYSKNDRQPDSFWLSEKR